MSINRNNYEEYFLLYADNELSAAEKNMVDAFVAANTDLQEELVMLQQSIVQPGTVEFPGKENLLKPVAVDAATEEELLLLLDNELGAKEKEGMLLSIQNNTAIQKEWALLQQTKLSPAGTIIFEDKASLYKREGSRVVPIKWWRMAAAAALIGFGLWGTVSYFNKEEIKTVPFAETVTATPPAGINKDKGLVAPAAKEATASGTNTVGTQNSTAKTTGSNTATAEENPVKEKKPAILSPKEDKEEKNMAVQQDDDESPVQPFDNINNNDSNKKILATVQPEIQINKAGSINDIPAELKNPIAINTSFKNETGDKNSFAFDDDERPKKTKLGGFFKKVKRVLERNTKIKPGSDDEVRIANMSFAMH